MNLNLMWDTGRSLILNISSVDPYLISHLLIMAPPLRPSRGGLAPPRSRLDAALSRKAVRIALENKQKEKEVEQKEKEKEEAKKEKEKEEVKKEKRKEEEIEEKKIKSEVVTGSDETSDSIIFGE